MYKEIGFQAEFLDLLMHCACSELKHKVGMMMLPRKMVKDLGSKRECCASRESKRVDVV